MQPQEYDLVLERLHRFERRARWHWAERALTLGLAGWLFVTGPAGASLQRQIARLQPLDASHRARSVLAESIRAAQRALLVGPALDPERVLEDQHEASMDAMPLPPAEALAARSPRATTATATTTTKYRFHQRPELLAARRPIPSRTSSQTAAAATQAAPLAAGESSLSWSSSVSEAERQMARAADKSAEPMASLMDSPVASGMPILNSAGSAGLPFPLPGELAAPEALWRAVGTAKSHRQLAAGRDPFSFAAPFASQPGQSPRARSKPALRGSQPDAFVSGSAPAASPSTMPAAEPAPAVTGTQALTAPALPAISFKALGYAESADGTAQAVLSDGSTLYVVNEGEEFAEHYRVIAIRREDLEVEDEVTNQTFRLPLGD